MSYRTKDELIEAMAGLIGRQYISDNDLFELSIEEQRIVAACVAYNRFATPITETIMIGNYDAPYFKPETYPLDLGDA